MRKGDIYKNMNRNSTMVNHFQRNDERTDSATPNIVMGQVWLQQDTAQVEIIELDSDDSDPELNEEQDFDFGKIWNYIDGEDRFSPPQPEFYQANRKAREKRRIRYLYDHEEDSSETYDNERNQAPNDLLFTRFYDFTNDISVKNNTTNHQTNCFTIINKPFNTPESSSDEIECKERLNTLDALNTNGTPYDDEVVTFDEDIDAAKRTIWIYSFRNKRILSDNDFELVNIPSRDSTSSTTCSLENEERIENTSVCRVSSPIPAAYVPRLNLSLAPTLPTVTEITEPTKSAKKETQKTDENTDTRQKCVNNWFAGEGINTKSLIKEINKQEDSGSTNVINWMCLSPRERRRRFKHTNAGFTYQPKLPVLAEVPSSEPITRSPPSENGSNKFQTTAEINIVEKQSPKVQTQSSKGSLLVCRTKNNGQSNKVTVDGDEVSNELDALNLLQKPRIIVNVDRTVKTKITDPIEKLHSNNWIQEDAKAERERNLDESGGSEHEILEIKNVITHQRAAQECAGKKLWVRNMSLLKPVEWSEFMPITESIPSLHLSIESDTRKHTWFWRLAKCFRCFK